MSKYEFNEELKAYEHQNMPIIPVVVPILQFLMGFLYKMEKSDEAVTMEQIKIPAEDGKKLRMMLYTPMTVQENGPCIIFIHGGGFVYRAAPHHFSLARKFAKELNCKVFMVDYRLAPKYKFPIAPNDSFTCYKWILDHAGQLKIDRSKIAICGDSAGGNLATVVSMMARDKKIQMPCAQILLYPVTDRRMCTESMKQYVDTPMCNTRDMEKYYKMYDTGITPEMLAYLSPMEAESLENMPPAYVEVAEYDCLHDEGIAYAECLQEAGVEVELHEVKKAMHGYDIAVNSQLMKDCMEKRVCYLRNKWKKAERAFV